MVFLASWHALKYKYYSTGIGLNVNNSVQYSHVNETLLFTEGTVGTNMKVQARLRDN